MEHVSVMVREVLEYLAPQPGGRYLDGTLGFGGHASALLRAVDGQAALLGLDRDPQALDIAQERLRPFGDSVLTAHTPFSGFEQALKEVGWDSVDGVLLDLGVSSLQLDAPDRGFSFQEDGPLDMRMAGPELGESTAADLVNRAQYDELVRILREYGEEPLAGRIARAIVDARQKSPITRTLELEKIVFNAYPAKVRSKSRNHPATKTFQALRIAVNRELEELENFLERIVDYLRPGGRLVVISFHSLEDRQVKHFFRRESRDCLCPPRQLFCNCGHVAKLRILTRKPLGPGEDEVAVNGRARSAKLRAAERLASDAKDKPGK